MAKKTEYLNANLTYEDTFSKVVETINEIQYDLATSVVTTSPQGQPDLDNGGQTNGNTHINGILSSNTATAIDGIRGGTVSTSDTLHVLSDASFEGANVVITSGTSTYIKDTLSVSANATFTGNTFSVDVSNTATIDAANNIAIISPDIDVDSAVVTIGTDGTDSVTVNSDTSFTANVVIGSDSADQLDVNSITDLNANVNVDGILTTTNNATFGSDATDTFDVNSTADFNAAVNVDGILTTTNSATIGSDETNTLTVNATTTFNSNTTIGDDASNDIDILTVNANTQFNNDVYIGSDGADALSVNAETTFNSNVTIGDTTDGVDNLTVNANTTFTDDVAIEETLTVNGDTTLGDDIAVDTVTHTANTVLGGELHVTGQTKLNGNATIGNADTDTMTVEATTTFKADVTIGDTTDGADTLTVNANTFFTDDVDIEESLTVDGNTILGTDTNTQLTVNANTEFKDKVDMDLSLNVDGAVTLNTTLDVDGATTLNGNVTLGDDADDTVTVEGNTVFNANATFDDAIIANGNTTIGSANDDVLTVNANTTFVDKVVVSETLSVTNAASFANTVSVTGAATFSDTVTVTNATSLNGDVTLGDAADDELIVNANTGFVNNVEIGSDGTDALNVNATSTFNNNVTIGSDENDTLTVNSNTTFTDDVDIEETLNVDGNVTLGTVNSGDATLTDTTVTVNSNTTINYDTTVNGTFSANGDTDIGTDNTNTLDVNATADFNASVNVDGILTTTNSATIGSDGADILTVNATANLVSNTTIGNDGSDELVVNANTGFVNNVQIGSDNSDELIVNANTEFKDKVIVSETLDVTNAVSFANTFTVTGDTTLNSALSVSGTSSLNGDVDLGNAATDTITFTGEVDSDILPSANVSHNIGSSDDQWDNIYVEDTHVSANTNTNRVVIKNADSEIVVSNIDDQSVAHGSLTVQFDHANTGVANVETVTFTSTTIEPVTNEGISLGTSSANFLESYIADSHIDKVDTDIISSNTVTLKIDNTTESAIIEMHLIDDPENGYESVVDITADSVNVIGPFTVSGGVILGDAETDLHTINGDTTFTHDVVINKTLTATSSVTLGEVEADLHTINGDTTFSHDVAINQTLTVTEGSTLEQDVILASGTTSASIIPTANTKGADTNDVANGWSNIGSSTKYFRNIYVDTINSPNFRIRDLNDTSSSDPVVADNNKVYAYNSTSQEFELQSVAALASQGITTGDLNDVSITSLANGHILYAVDTDIAAPIQNVELEINIISDAVTYDKGAGSYSIGIGEGALSSLAIDGDYNSALGKNALGALTTGDNNVGLGSGAGSNLTTGSGNIYIGRSVQATSNSKSNEIVIGTSSITDFKLGTILTANTTKLAVATNRELTANTATLSGTLALNNSDALSFEDGKHWITHNDDGGNFNIRVGHYDNAAGHAESTEAGYAFHDLWDQTAGTKKFNISDSSLTVEDTDDADFSWRTQIKYDNNSVELSYQGAKVIETVSGGVSVTGTLATSSNVTVGGDLTVTGNLEVQGTRTFINTTTLDVEDNIIVLNKNYSGDGGSGASNAGIEIERGTAANVSLLFDETTNRWSFTNDGSNYHTFATSAELEKFKTISVNSNGSAANNIVADARTDTLTIDSAPNIIYDTDNTTPLYTTNGIDLSTSADTLTISHADTSSIKATANNGVCGTAGITSLTVDNYGHVTAVSTATLDNYVKWKASANGVTSDITSSDTLTITGGNGIDAWFASTDDDILNIKNTKPFDKLIIKGNAVGTKDITNSDQITFFGDSDITVTVSNTSATDFKVNVDHDNITRSDTTSADAPSYSGNFEAVTSVVTNARGHVTAIDVSTISLPAIYSLPIATPSILGGIKVGSGLTSDANGTLSITSLAMHRAIVTRNNVTTFNLASGVVEVGFNLQEHLDTGVFTHNTSTNNSRVEVDVDGVYNINYMVGINSSGSDRSTIEGKVYVNGSALPYTTRGYDRGNSYGDKTIVQQTLPPVSLNAGDYIQVKLEVVDEDGTYTYSYIPSETTLSVNKVGSEIPSNTQRPIHDIPANGSTTTSISSNWAYDHRNNDGTITAGSKGPASATSPGYGGSFNVPYITYDGSGHITGIQNSSITLPSADANNTLSQVLTAGNTSTSSASMGGLTLTSSTSANPIFKMENTNTDAVSPLIRIGKTTTNEANGDDLAQFQFYGKNSLNTEVTYAELLVESTVVTSTTQSGKFKFKVLAGASFKDVLDVGADSSSLPRVTTYGDLYIGDSSSTQGIYFDQAAKWGKLVPATLSTTNKTWTLPNASGTVALTSDLTNFLTSESDTLTSVTNRGATTTNDIKIGDLNFGTNANTVMDAGGKWWFQGKNSISNADGISDFIIGNSSYDYDDNAISTLELRQYGYSSTVGPTVTGTNTTARIDFTDKHQQSASGADSTSTSVRMADIRQKTQHTSTGKTQIGELILSSYKTSNTVNGSSTNAAAISIGDGLLYFETNLLSGELTDANRNIVFDQAGVAPKSVWMAGGLDQFYIENDLDGATTLHAVETVQSNGNLILSADSDLLLDPTDNVYMRSGGNSGDQLKFELSVTGQQSIVSSDQMVLTSNNNIYLMPYDDTVFMRGGGSTGQQISFQLDTTTQVIAGSDALNLGANSGALTLYTLTSGDIDLNPATGKIGLFDNGIERAGFDVNTSGPSTLKIYTGSNFATLNSSFAGADLIVQGDVTSLSDRRTKENIETIDNGLEVVSSLRGVRYNKIGEEDRKVGVIAQEVEEVLPEVVKTDYEGMKSVDYGKMVGVLIEAIKEQQSQIELLKVEIEELKK